MTGCRRELWMLVGLLALGLIMFGGSLGGGFLADDYFLIHHASKGGFLAEFYTPVEEGTNPLFYRPVWRLLILLNYELFGIASLGHRLASLVLHVLTAFLLSRVAHKITDSRGCGVVAGFAFLVFPAHYQAVMWVASSCDLLALLFGVAALDSLTTHRGGVVSPGRRAAAAVFVLLAMLSKESALLLPGTCLWLTLCSPRAESGGFTIGARGRRAVRLLVPLLPVVVVYFAVRYSVLGVFLGGYDGQREAEFDIVSAASGVRDALVGVLVPARIGVVGGGLAWAVAVFSVSVLLLGSGVALSCHPRSRPGFLFLAGWLMFAVLPVSRFGFDLETHASSRHVYAIAAPYCVLLSASMVSLARLLISRFPGGDPENRVFLRTMGCCGIVVVMLFIAVLRTNKRDYETAGAIARQANIDLFAPLHGTQQVFIYDLPNYWNGVPLFLNVSWALPAKPFGSNLSVPFVFTDDAKSYELLERVLARDPKMRHFRMLFFDPVGQRIVDAKTPEFIKIDGTIECDSRGLYTLRSDREYPILFSRDELQPLDGRRVELLGLKVFGAKGPCLLAHRVTAR